MGEPSPRRLLARMDLREVGVWRGLWELSPWGEERADLRAALGHMLHAEIHRDRKRRPNAFELKEFMPYYRAPERVDPAPAVEAKILKAFGVKLDPKKLKRKR